MALNQRVFANVESFKWIGRILVNNEVRWLSVESVPRKLSHGGAAWEGVMIDITDMKESEFALKLAHERLTASEVERSALEERERLLQDMHDGFGSQLSSARIMAEQGTLDQPQLKELLQECMSDLYLVVDTLGSNGKTLAVAIGDFRFRTDRRTSGLRSKIHWDLRLDHLPPIPDRKILQILRILQEALSNALKHSGGLNIWVNAVFLPEQNLLRLSVADDGVGMSQKPQQGRGLSSMKQRAREIGGSLYFPDPFSGTQVVIELSDFA
jgi:signal transduction histidine kinase